MKRLRKSFIKWLVVSLFCLLLGFLLGKFKQTLLEGELLQTQQQLTQQTQDRLLRVKKIARFETQAQLDKLAIQALVEENKILNGTLAEAKNKIYFYERVIAPEKEGRGVKIYSFNVEKNKHTGLWEYELVLMQLQKGQRLLQGQFELQVSFVEQDKLYKKSLKKFTDDSENTFKFKYFQKLKGAFSLPDDMQIDEVLITLNVQGDRRNKPQEIEKSYDWRVLLNKSNEPLSEFDKPIIPLLESQ